MKFIISILLIALLSFVACLYLPWWTIAIAAFVVAIFIPQPPLRSFLTGFAALFLLWGGLAIWIDSRNEHVLSHRIAAVLPFGGSTFVMLLVTALVGALVAGFASLSASYFRKVN